MIWFTADSHHDHANIIKYCGRPFASVEEMDAELIRRWNEVVAEDDLVYHLGDFCLSGSSVAWEYFRQLEGKVKILGNYFHHDKYWLSKADSVDFYTRAGKVEITAPIITIGKKQPIVLCHYPLAIWDRKHYGSWHLHGHSHGKYLGEGKILDVGVDRWDFYPVSLDEITERLK